MTHYLGNALRLQKINFLELRVKELRQHLLELIFSFIAGIVIGLCFGMEYVVKWLG